MTWAWCEDCAKWRICSRYSEWTEYGFWPHFLCRDCALARMSPKARACIRRVFGED